GGELRRSVPSPCDTRSRGGRNVGTPQSLSRPWVGGGGRAPNLPLAGSPLWFCFGATSTPFSTAAPRRPPPAPAPPPPPRRRSCAGPRRGLAAERPCARRTENHARGMSPLIRRVCLRSMGPADECTSPPWHRGCRRR